MGSALSEEIEASKLLYIYTYETKKICPLVSAAIEEKRLRRDKKVYANCDEDCLAILGGKESECFRKVVYSSPVGREISLAG